MLHRLFDLIFDGFEVDVGPRSDRCLVIFVIICYIICWTIVYHIVDQNLIDVGKLNLSRSVVALVKNYDFYKIISTQTSRNTMICWSFWGQLLIHLSINFRLFRYQILHRFVDWFLVYFWFQNDSKSVNSSPPWRDLFGDPFWTSILGSLLAALGLPFGTLLAPFWSPWAFLGSSWLHFGVLLGPFWRVGTSLGAC